jgi:hypothetical protein
MKKIYCFIFFQILHSISFGQNFEGKIIYKVINVDSVNNLRSTEIDEEYFKDANFKVVNIDSSDKLEWYDKDKNKYFSLLRNLDTFKTPSETLPFEQTIQNYFSLQWSLYINSDNRYYAKFSNSDTLKWTDGSLNHDSIISMHINKDVVKVLGYNCDELIINCNNGIKKYYYNSSNFRMDAKQFIKYKSGNWTDFLLMTNSLPLMQIEDSQNNHFETIAIDIVEMKLDEAFLKLPKNSITAKNDY